MFNCLLCFSYSTEKKQYNNIHLLKLIFIDFYINFLDRKKIFFITSKIRKLIMLHDHLEFIYTKLITC